MLMVTELLRVASGARAAAELRASRPLRFGGSPATPPVVVWNVCRHCNMTCPHCYAAADSRPSRFDLSTEEGLRLLGEMAEAGVKVVIFSGGEPLLRPDLLRLIARATEVGLSPQLSTNGSLIDADVAADLRVAGVGYVGVSIDGPERFNDAHRGLEGGFARAVAGLRHAKRAGLRTGLRMTLTGRNAHLLEPVLQVAREIGVDRFYASHLVDAGRGRALAGEDLGREEARRLMHRLFEWAERFADDRLEPEIVTGSNDSDGVSLLHWVLRRHGEAAAERVAQVLRQRGGNSAGERILNVDHRGSVHPDQFWQAADLGNVRRKPFAEILEHPLRRELARRVERLKGRCGACRHVDLCRGSHRERALARSGDPWASDPACVATDAEIGLSVQLATKGE